MKNKNIIRNIGIFILIASIVSLLVTISFPEKALEIINKPSARFLIFLGVELSLIIIAIFIYQIFYIPNVYRLIMWGWHIIATTGIILAIAPFGIGSIENATLHIGKSINITLDMAIKSSSTTFFIGCFFIVLLTVLFSTLRVIEEREGISL